MICHANTSSAELIEYLRDVAIRAKAKPAWIDALDRLQDADTIAAELEERDGELYDLKENFNDMRDTLERLLAAVEKLYTDAAAVPLDPENPNSCCLEYLAGDLPELRREAAKVLADYPEPAL